MLGVEQRVGRWECKKVCLYLEELALVQHRPDARQSEPTDVAVTDISPLRLPPVRPHEYGVKWLL